MSYVINDTSYYNTYSRKLKKCKSKKDYKRLCKLMLSQLAVIDSVDENMWKIFASTIGEDAYSEALALAIRMSMLERSGIPCDILSIENP